MKPMRVLGEWWQARDGRERRMLVAMIAMLAAFGYWYGLIVPLQHLREATHADYLQTVRQVESTAADLARIAALRRTGPRTPDAASLPGPVLASAKQAGLAISRQREQAGGLRVEVDAAETANVLAWLDLLRERHGLAPRTLTIERQGGDVRVQAAFGH